MFWEIMSETFNGNENREKNKDGKNKNNQEGYIKIITDYNSGNETEKRIY